MFTTSMCPLRINKTVECTVIYQWSFSFLSFFLSIYYIGARLRWHGTYIIDIFIVLNVSSKFQQSEQITRSEVFDSQVKS